MSDAGKSSANVGCRTGLHKDAKRRTTAARVGSSRAAQPKRASTSGSGSRHISRTRLVASLIATEDSELELSSWRGWDQPHSRSGGHWFDRAAKHAENTDEQWLFLAGIMEVDGWEQVTLDDGPIVWTKAFPTTT